MSRDTTLLFATRGVRLFAYGFLSVVLVLYVSSLQITEHRIGTLLSLTLVGDVAISLFLTTHADRIGRRRTLVIGAFLMLVAALVFATTHDFTLLVVAATIGVISPSGNEVGPFLAVEQTALAQTTPADSRTSVFAWYNLTGSFATALGALAAGLFTHYRTIVIGYGLLGALMALMFMRLSPRVERNGEPRVERNGAPRVARNGAPASAGLSSLASADLSSPPSPGLSSPASPGLSPPASPGLWSPAKAGAPSRIVAKLSALFALDSFAGGLVVQSIVAYWFYRRFGLSPAIIGAIFFGANLLAGVSALAAARIARRVGLVNTMVFTHLPSNVLLMLVPLMPRLNLAIIVLLARFSISQMDVPTRQSYLMAVVDESERTAAAGITGVARTCGAALAPVLAMPLIAGLAHDWVPFVAAGVLKIVYDLALLWSTRSANVH